MPSRLSDPGLLVPAFWERAEPVLKMVAVRGYPYVIWETLRSLERSARLVQTGKSQVTGGPSMHCYGVALDAVCKAHRWDCEKHGCAFYSVLHQEALAAKLTRVRLTNKKTGKKFWDGPHIQAVPVSMQARVRATAPEHINTLVRAYFAGLVGAGPRGAP